MKSQRKPRRRQESVKKKKRSSEAPLEVKLRDSNMSNNSIVNGLNDIEEFPDYGAAFDIGSDRSSVANYSQFASEHFYSMPLEANYSANTTTQFQQNLWHCPENTTMDIFERFRCESSTDVADYHNLQSPFNGDSELTEVLHSNDLCSESGVDSCRIQSNYSRKCVPLYHVYDDIMSSEPDIIGQPQDFNNGSSDPRLVFNNNPPKFSHLSEPFYPPSEREFSPSNFVDEGPHIGFFNKMASSLSDNVQLSQEMESIDPRLIEISNPSFYDSTQFGSFGEVPQHSAFDIDSLWKQKSCVPVEDNSNNFNETALISSVSGSECLSSDPVLPDDLMALRMSYSIADSHLKASNANQGRKIRNSVGTSRSDQDEAVAPYSLLSKSKKKSIKAMKPPHFINKENEGSGYFFMLDLRGQNNIKGYKKV